MHIRSFHADDRDAVIALWQACKLTRPWNNPALDIERKCALADDLFLVGELEPIGNNPNGTPSSTIVASVMAGYDGHRGWVNYLATSPEHRRLGLGRQMMEEVEARLLALGCPKINLQIRAENTEVIEFYTAGGFTEDKVLSMGKRLIPDS